MGFEDRPYYRDRSGPAWTPLQWVFYGSVPLFTAFGIRVRAMSWFVIYVAWTLLFGLPGQGIHWQDRVQSVVALFVIVLLHEFGHCFAARWVGGDAEDILMHPLGGLAMAHPPRRPLPTFITVAGGPMVNVIICVVCGALLWTLFGWVPWNPFYFNPSRFAENWFNIWRYVYWIYSISWMLLIFNLMPIYPLDGGQMLQAIMWPKLGYYKSTNASCIIGMIGAVLGAAIAIATSNYGLAILACCGFSFCLNKRRELIANGPMGDFEEAYDFSASLRPEPRRHVTRRSVKRAQRAAREAAVEQTKIDQILSKVSAHGMHSLTWWEKRTLHKATERQRKRESSRPRY